MMNIISYSCNYSNTCQNNHNPRVGYENRNETRVKLSALSSLEPAPHKYSAL